MVTNQSSLSEGWGQLTDWVGDKARAAGQAVGLVDDDLIPGNPETAGELAAHLGKLGGGFEQAGQGFKRIDTGGWQGQGSAAEGARGFLESCPPRWLKAADAFERAAKAVADYQRVLAESQAKAARAKEDLERAEKASAAAREQHNAQVDAFNASDRTGPRPGEFTDPAAGEIAAAKQAIEQAKAAVAEADQRAAREVLAAAAEAPAEPGFFARFGQDMTDLGQGVGRIAGSFLAGAGGAVVELGKLARLVNPTDPWKFAHPGEATEAAKTVAMGVIGAVQNPYAAVKTVVDPDGWRQDPAKNLGSMVPDALASLAGGAGVAGRVARSVGKIADAGTSLGRRGDDLARATPDAPSAPQAPTSQPSAPPRSTSGTPWGQGDLPPSSPQSPTSGTPWQNHDPAQVPSPQSSPSGSGTPWQNYDPVDAAPNRPAPDYSPPDHGSPNPPTPDHAPQADRPSHVDQSSASRPDAEPAAKEPSWPDQRRMAPHERFADDLDPWGANPDHFDDGGPWERGDGPEQPPQERSDEPTHEADGPGDEQPHTQVRSDEELWNRADGISDPEGRATDEDLQAYDEKFPRTPEDEKFLAEVRETMPHYDHLADQEVLSVRRWTTGTHYEYWNEALRERKPEMLAEHEPGIRALSSALNKLPEPAEPVTLHRGLQILPTDMPRFPDQVQTGKLYQDPGFGSTDANAPWSGSNVEMLLHTKQARDISDLSASNVFREWLLKPNSELEVGGSKPDDTGTHHVLLKDRLREGSHG